MASKEFVGPVDCYAALLPDEEYFLLMGRDPLMPGLTMIWASLRIGDHEAALKNFMALADPQMVRHYLANPDVAKSQEAVEVAQRGSAWRDRNLGRGQDKPTWKKSRAAGVERFVVEFVERRPDSQGGPTIVRAALGDLPFWSQPLYAKQLVGVSYGGATDGERQPPAETEGDCA